MRRRLSRIFFSPLHRAASMGTHALQAALRDLAARTTDGMSAQEVAMQLNSLADSFTMDSPDKLMEPPTSKRARKAPREFDFSRYRQRYVALELMYIGTTYQGFARQDCTDNTIEAALFAALKRVRLIPEDVPMSALKYSRCGRTDKGVSALGQVVALMLRSSARVEPTPTDNGNDPTSTMEHTPPASDAQGCVLPAEDEGLPSPEEELDYPRLINRSLPPEIRILGWSPAPPTFHARFSARFREYKYFIVDQDNRLDIPAMQRAAQLFLGQHDFRNFCKPDVLAVKSFERTITSFTLTPFGVESELPRPAPLPPALPWPTATTPAANTRGIAAPTHSLADLGPVVPAATHPFTATPVILLPPTSTPTQAPVTAMADHAPLDPTPTSIQEPISAPLHQAQGQHPTSTTVAQQPSLSATCQLSTASHGTLEQLVMQRAVEGAAMQARSAVRSEASAPGLGVDRSTVYVFTVRGTAFLWHQVRCMVAVLLMVGQRLEAPEVITRLLDITATPAKPTYMMAPEEPLLLYACGFEDLRFIRSGRLAAELSQHVRTITDSHLVAAALSGAMAARLSGDDQHQQQQARTETSTSRNGGAAGTGAAHLAQGREGVVPGPMPAVRGPAHVPLLRRPVEMSVAERMQKHGIVVLGDQKRAATKTQEEEVE